MVKIRCLEEGDAVLYRSIRLKALQEHPEFYGSSIEEEETRTITIFVFGLILSLFGFVTPSNETIELLVQARLAIHGIRIAMIGTMVILMILGYIAARRFVMTDQDVDLKKKLMPDDQLPSVEPCPSLNIGIITIKTGV